MADTDKALASPRKQEELKTAPAEESQPEEVSPMEKTPVPLPAADGERRVLFPKDAAQKNGSPDPVEVPKRKAFRFPERYRSPTDLIMSPVSRGLVAMNRKTAILSLHEANRSKVLSSTDQDAALFT